MASVYRELLEIEKSQLTSGKYIRASLLTPAQRAKLRADMGYARSVKPKGGRHGLMGGKTTKEIEQINDLKNDVNLVAQQTRGMRGHGATPYRPSLRDVLGGNKAGTPADLDEVNRAMRRQGVRRRVSVTRQQPIITLTGGGGAGGGVAAGARPMSRHTGDIVIMGEEPTFPGLISHEVAHLSPKRRTASRMMQIGQDPLKTAREEARADAVAARQLPGNRVASSGYEQAAQFRRIADLPSRVYRGPFRSLGRKASGEIHGAMDRATNLPFDQQQAAEYRRIRRRLGSPVPLSPF